MSASPDVLIIGAGIVGTSIALALSKEGLRTLNLDALPAAGYGSTSHSSAIIRPFYTHTDAAALAHASRCRWETWQDFLDLPSDAPLARYTENGMVALLFEGAEDYGAQKRALGDAGIDFEIWNKATLETRLPGITSTSYAPPKRIDDDTFGNPGKSALQGALFIPQSGFVNDPQLAAQNLMQAAKERGAEFHFNTKVSAIRHDDRINGVELETGEILDAPIIVNAAGPHSAKINTLAGADNLPILATKAMRHEVVYLAQPRAFETNMKTAPTVMDEDVGSYMRPDGADLLVGTLDPPCDPREFVDPNNYNEAFTDQWTNQAWRAGLRLPDLEIPGQARGTIGLYDVSEDWIPIYDKTDRPGYYVAIGTSGNQFKNAPYIGEIMARIILETENGGNPDKNSLDFFLPEIDHTIRLAHYSRLRNVQSTSSVLA